LGAEKRISIEPSAELKAYLERDETGRPATKLVTGLVERALASLEGSDLDQRVIDDLRAKLAKAEDAKTKAQRKASELERQLEDEEKAPIRPYWQRPHYPWASRAEAQAWWEGWLMPNAEALVADARFYDLKGEGILPGLPFAWFYDRVLTDMLAYTAGRRDALAQGKHEDPAVGLDLEAYISDVLSRRIAYCTATAAIKPSKLQEMARSALPGAPAEQLEAWIYQYGHKEFVKYLKLTLDAEFGEEEEVAA